MNITINPANSTSVEIENLNLINKKADQSRSYEDDCRIVTHFDPFDDHCCNGGNCDEHCCDMAKFSKFTLIGKTLILKKSSPRFREDAKGNKKKNEQLICIYCKTRTSRTWRKGPDGRKSLCNSCGLRFYRLLVKERKIQPANTPNPIQSILN